MTKSQNNKVLGRLSAACASLILSACSSPLRYYNPNTDIVYDSSRRPVQWSPPEYPASAVKAKFEGDVVLTFVVGDDGKARDIEVVESLGFPLDPAAVEAVKRAVFLPENPGERVYANAAFRLN